MSNPKESAMHGIFYFLHFHPCGLAGRTFEGVLWFVQDTPLEDAEQFRSYSFWLGKEC